MPMNDNSEDWKWIYGFTEGINDSNIGLVRKADELGLQPHDLAIFQAIHFDYGQVEERSSLARRSSVAEDAVDRCFQEGWIQVVTTEFEDEMRSELHGEGYVLVAGLFSRDILREVRGESVAGIISFTRLGAELWNQWLRDDNGDPGVHWAVGFDREQTRAAFGTTVNAVTFAITSVCEDASLEHPFTRGIVGDSGPWCDCWWRRFQVGFQIRYSCELLPIYRE